MIVLFTDFGLHGPYTGQMKAVLHQMAPSIPIIDLFSDAPVGNPRASAYLLASYAAWFSVGAVFLCVVDPGVGGARSAIILEADGRWYVGPGNGLFELVQRRARQARSWDIPIARARDAAPATTFRLLVHQSDTPTQSCHTDRCPTGVATQDRSRQRALVVNRANVQRM